MGSEPDGDDFIWELWEKDDATVMNIHLLRIFQRIPMTFWDGRNVVVLDVFVQARPVELLGEVSKKKSHSLVDIRKPSIRWMPAGQGWWLRKEQIMLMFVCLLVNSTPCAVVSPLSKQSSMVVCNNILQYISAVNISFKTRLKRNRILEEYEKQKVGW